MFKLEVLYKENASPTEKKVAVLNQLDLSEKDFNHKVQNLDSLVLNLFEGFDVMNDYHALSEQDKGTFILLVCKKVASCLDRHMEDDFYQKNAIPEVVKNIFINFFTKTDPSVTFAGFKTEIGSTRFFQWNFEKFPEAVKLFTSLRDHVSNNIKMDDYNKRRQGLIEDPNFYKVDNAPLNLPG